jgi:hypothetical protein
MGKVHTLSLKLRATPLSIFSPTINCIDLSPKTTKTISISLNNKNTLHNFILFFFKKKNLKIIT